MHSSIKLSLAALIASTLSLPALASAQDTTAAPVTSPPTEVPALPVPPAYLTQPAPLAPAPAVPSNAAAPVAPASSYGQTDYESAPASRGHRYQPARGRAIVGYRTEQRNPPELWGTGIALLLGGWLLDFAVLTPIANGMSNDRSEANEQDSQAWALVPLVGPFVQLGIEAPHPAIPILAGGLQIAGLVCFILGLTTQETNHVPIYEGSPQDPRMLHVELDAGATGDGGHVTLTVRHL